MTTPEKPCLFLVDGFALIFRAFFAMINRPLTTGKGENTSVAWGVANFLLRTKDKYDPDYIVWVHDAGHSFRKDIFPEYKATREKLDDDLQEIFDRSVERTIQLLEAFQVPLLAVDGYEADDVIGTLAHDAEGAGVTSVIVSGDKDFYQLIGPRTFLLNPGRGGPAAVQEEFVTPENASERLGVPPERVTDYLAMVGDSSDNVPGVHGIGDKTARTLIEQYGDLDTILQHAEEVKGKRAREGLLACRDDALLSRRLVTIQKDVPVGVSIEEFKAREPRGDDLRELLTELEFHTLVDRVPASTKTQMTETPASFAVIDSVEELQKTIHRIKSEGSMALATFGASRDARAQTLDGMAVALDSQTAWYLPFAHRPPDGELLNEKPPKNLPALSDSSMRPLVELLEDEAVKKMGHDLKQDLLRLRTAGIDLAGAQFDASVASFLLDPGKRSHAIDALSAEFLSAPLEPLTMLLGKGKAERPFAETEVSQAGDFACSYAAAVIALKAAFQASLEAAGLDKLLSEIEIPMVRVLADMEWRGIGLDTDRLAELSVEFREELQKLEAEIFKEAGSDFNINSTQQLRHVLFEKLQLPVIKKTKTGASTDADVLVQLAAMGFEVPKLLLRYRELTKLRSTYVDALPKSVNAETRRVHTKFNQTGAATGRLSSSDPNLQNIPVRTERGGEIRRCFVPAPGLLFVIADYSQIELRLLAHLSKDPAFISAFERGGDIHRETAAIIFDVATKDVTNEMRARAKTINFATIYGQGPFALARQLEITQDEAKEFIETYFERFAGVRTYMDETIATAKERGFVETLFGRRRYIPELKDKNFNMRAFGERTAMNSPLQGSAADLIKIAMIDLDDALKTRSLESAMLLQVHDELVLEAPKPEVDEVVELVREKMSGAVELDVPLVVDVGVGPNWLDAKQ